jgi:hypothetical protein
MKLRHVPLLIVRHMADHPRRDCVTRPGQNLFDFPYHPGWISKTLAEVIQRPDELNEFLAIYWKNRKQPLSKQVKLGLAKAFQKFNEYELAKYNRDKDIKLRDVLFLCHSKPADVPATASKFTKVERKSLFTKEQQAFRPDGYTDGEKLYYKLVNNSLEIPDTWEVALSGGADKKETFERLMAERKLGALAFLRNLRNMGQAGVPVAAIQQYGDNLNFERTLPFRFVAAARMNPGLEHIIEPWMLKALENQTKLPGRTLFLVDVSGSMFGTKVSARSELDRFDAAAALTMLGRDICEDVVVYSFSAALKQVPARRGFALRDALSGSQPHSSTYLGQALAKLGTQETWDRIIVITDEQSHDTVPNLPGRKYVINVASYQNSIVNDTWTRITGWSEAVIDYIRMYESM